MAEDLYVDREDLKEDITIIDNSLIKRLKHSCVQAKTVKIITWIIAILFTLLALNTNLALQASSNSNDAQREVFKTHNEMVIKMAPVEAEMKYIRESLDEIKVILKRNPTTP